MNPLLIQIEQKHIDEGIPLNQCLCPVALAINKPLENVGATYIRVVENLTTLYINKKIITLHHEPKLENWIATFDTIKAAKRNTIPTCTVYINIDKQTMDTA